MHTSLIAHLSLMRRTQIEQYDVDATELFSYMVPELVEDQKTPINTAIVNLKAAGIWSKLDRFGIMVTKPYASQQQGLIDWQDPTKSITLNGASTWSPSEGYMGSHSVGAYADTNFIPSIDGVNFTLDDSSLGLYINTIDTHGDVNGASIGGAIGTYIQPSPLNFNFTHPI